MNLDWNLILQWTQGRVFGSLPALPCLGVGTDTRDLQPGSLFVALQGPNFDAHDFVPAARQAGAVAALVARRVDDPLPQILVDAPLVALGQLAAGYRGCFNLPVIAVTGNSGKTSVKEMLAAILQAAWGSVLATRGNLNNAIGVPLTLLRLKAEHQAAVIELGANHAGEIDYLAQLVAAETGIITNVTGAHLGEFGGLSQIAAAKAELLGHLSACAILNADDGFYACWRDQAATPVISFGLRQGDVHLQQADLDERGCVQGQLVTPWQSATLKLQLPGWHNARNALAALAAAGRLGVDMALATRALAALEPVKGRLQPLRGRAGSHLLDDTYNASPGAVRAAIDLLAHLPGKRYLVLGNLAELGAATRSIHQELGEYARQQQLDGVFTLGEDAAWTAKAFGTPQQAFDEADHLILELETLLAEGVTLLVKGSRSARMERIVQGLQATGPF